MVQKDNFYKEETMKYLYLDGKEYVTIVQCNIDELELHDCKHCAIVGNHIGKLNITGNSDAIFLGYNICKEMGEVIS